MKRLIAALLIITVFSACKKNDYGDTNLHINGNIKGLKKGKLFIQKVVDTNLIAIDTIVINGKSSFESHLKLDSPQMLYLFLDRGQTNSIDNNLPFFAEPGKITIESANEEFFAKAKITGSKNQKVYEEYMKIKKRFNGENLDLIKQNLEATKNSNIQQLDSIEKQGEQLLKRRYLYTVNFALNHSKYEVSPYIALSEIYDANTKYLDTIQKSMSPEVANSYYGKMLTKYVEDRKKAETEIIKEKKKNRLIN